MKLQVFSVKIMNMLDPRIKIDTESVEKTKEEEKKEIRFL